MITALENINLVSGTGHEAVLGSTAVIEDRIGGHVGHRNGKGQFDVDIDRQGQAPLPDDIDPVREIRHLKRVSAALRIVTVFAWKVLDTECRMVSDPHNPPGPVPVAMAGV